MLFYGYRMYGASLCPSSLNMAIGAGTTRTPYLLNGNRENVKTVKGFAPSPSFL